MKPHVMIAETTCIDYVKRIDDLGWGRMFCFWNVTLNPLEKWGFDNGAYKDWQDAGFPRDLSIDDWYMLWDAQGYEERLSAAREVPHDPLLAVVPDIPGSRESLKFSIQWMSELPRDWPWYLAVQDGMSTDEVAEVLHLFAGIFLGGTNEFKFQAYRWSRLAHIHQKKFHYGRAGTPRKLRHAIKVDADSLDSSFPLWTKERFDTFVKHWRHDSTQQEMAFG